MSEDPIRARLRRLNARTEPAHPPAQSGACAEERRDVFARLARRARGTAWVAQPAVSGEPVAHAPRALSLGTPRELNQSERGTWARTAWYEAGHQHGSRRLNEVFDVTLNTLAERARDERLKSIDLSRALFFDTETTGLSGGAGTYVYLVGLGRFTAGRFELWQGFLPHPAEEKRLLEEVSLRIADASVLVSFFGKSFDRHRLEDKMRLHGVTPPFESTIHLDLYHPLRRAHRGQFENCKLKTLERELVGVVRTDDLPGSFAPAAWFDFLAHRPHRLEGVFQHNADDVLSLATLMCAVAT
ncbi:MAG: ribonuclease H-like domain-containing protein [Planctomycetes bacterium]|nr:ribonuclease H-like domain-containing protein [Planctomycetota bacterium]